MGVEKLYYYGPYLAIPSMKYIDTRDSSPIENPIKLRLKDIYKIDKKINDELFAAVIDTIQVYAGEKGHLAYDFWIPNRQIDTFRRFSLSRLDSCHVHDMSIADYNVKQIEYDIESFRKAFMSSIDKIVKCYTLLPEWDKDLLTRFGPVIYYM